MDEIRITRYINPERDDIMYPVDRVKVGYDFWYWKILNILIDIFEYDNLPSGITSRDIELNLMLTGHAVFIPEDGTLFTPITSLSGFDKYYQPTLAVWANPVVQNSRVWELHEECEIVYNSRLHDYVWYIKADNSMCSFIGKYARLLADIESTIDIYTVNSRLSCVPATDDQNVAKSIRLFFKKLAMGERAIITDSNIIQQFRNIDINRANINDSINDWLIARDKVLEMMFRDLGIKMYNPKKAQVNEMEVESNDQLLLVSLDDMKKAREEGIEGVNDMFGYDIKVKLNPRFNVDNFSEREPVEEVTVNE